MKKYILILIILILNIINIKSQTVKDPNGYLNHFTVGYMSGFVVKSSSYNFLAKRTSLDLAWCRSISSILGMSSGFVLGHLKENYDKRNTGNYSNNDLIYTGLGSILGDFTIVILIHNSVPKNRIPIEETDELYKEPLVKK